MEKIPRDGARAIEDFLVSAALVESDRKKSCVPDICFSSTAVCDYFFWEFFDRNHRIAGVKLCCL